jgi:hypothetical protein
MNILQNMDLFDFISWYIILGCINIIIISLILDWADRRGALTIPFDPTMEQRLAMLALWPVTTFIFWYNFLKSYFDNLKR